MYTLPVSGTSCSFDMCRSRHPPACFICGKYGDALWNEELLVWKINKKLKPLRITNYNLWGDDGGYNQDNHIYACEECMADNKEDFSEGNFMTGSELKMARQVYIKQNKLKESNRSNIPQERMKWEMVRYLTWIEPPSKTSVEMFQKDKKKTYLKCKIFLLPDALSNSESFETHKQKFVIEKDTNENFTKHVVVVTSEDVIIENQEPAIIAVCQVCFESENYRNVNSIQLKNKSIQTACKDLDSVFISEFWMLGLVKKTTIKEYVFKFIEWVCPDDLVKLSHVIDKSDMYKDNRVDNFAERLYTTEYNRTDDPDDHRHIMKPVRKNLKNFIL
jgi:hypothetical protein